MKILRKIFPKRKYWLPAKVAGASIISKQLCAAQNLVQLIRKCATRCDRIRF